MPDLFYWIAPNIGTILTAIGLFLTWRALKANHDWNRRQYAATLVASWNKETSAHRRFIEHARPGLLDVDSKKANVVELTKEDVNKIYSSDPGTDEWELRFHFIELLNYFEDIGVAHRNHIGDREILEESLRQPMERYHEILHNFIGAVRRNRGYEPWEPYTTLVQSWKLKPRTPRRPTA